MHALLKEEDVTVTAIAYEIAACQDRDLCSPRAAEVVETVLLRDAHHLALDSFISKQPSLRSSEGLSNMVRIGLLIGLSQRCWCCRLMQHTSVLVMSVHVRGYQLASVHRSPHHVEPNCLTDRYQNWFVQGRARQTQLNKLVEKFLLRRTKDSTIKDQLPKKTDNIVFCEMSLLQHRAYE